MSELASCTEGSNEEGMKLYRVRWLETNIASATVEARSEAEAIQKIKDDDFDGGDMETEWFGERHADSFKCSDADEEDENYTSTGRYFNGAEMYGLHPAHEVNP
jgi:hypothetical protein